MGLLRTKWSATLSHVLILSAPTCAACHWRRTRSICGPVVKPADAHAAVDRFRKARRELVPMTPRPTPPGRRSRAQAIAPTISFTIAGLCLGAKPIFTGTPETSTAIQGRDCSGRPERGRSEKPSKIVRKDSRERPRSGFAADCSPAIPTHRWCNLPSRLNTAASSLSASRTIYLLCISTR